MEPNSTPTVVEHRGESVVEQNDSRLPTDQVSEAYNWLDSRIQQCQFRATEAFWELGWAMKRMQRACPQCLYMPSDEEWNPNKRACPNCGGELGLYRVHFDTFEAYMADIGIRKQTGYKWISLHDTFDRHLSKIGQMASPEDLQTIEDREVATEGEQVSDIDEVDLVERKRERWAERKVMQTGWTKLEEIEHQVQDNPDQVVEILSQAQHMSRSDIRQSTSPDYPLKQELESLSSHLGVIRAHLRYSRLGQAETRIDDMEGTLRHMRREIQEIRRQEMVEQQREDQDHAQANDS